MGTGSTPFHTEIPPGFPLKCGCPTCAPEGDPSLTDYETSPGDHGLVFDDEVYESGDSRKIIARLDQIIADLRLALRLDKRGAKIYASLMNGEEPRIGFWRRLFLRLKARWIEWRNDDKHATATGNDRCRRDVWAGREFVEKVEAEEGTW